MFIDKIAFIGEDTRRRRFILPERILSTAGKVENAEGLLLNKPLQIGLNEPAVTTLDNRNSPENAGILLDFGFEFHGSLRLLCAGIDRGSIAQVRLCFGESAAEAFSRVGEKNATNDHSPRDIAVTLSMLSDNEFAQTGYRFVYIELMTAETAVRIKSAVGVFIYRDMPYLGSFSCDDPLINRIYETAAYTCHLNMQTLVWDGIKRDRLVWIGDMHPEMLTIRTLFGKTDLIEQSLHFVKEQTPLPGWMNGIPSYSLWWLIIVWDLYWYTGDTAFLEEQKGYILPLIRQILGHIQEDGADTFPGYFLDWPTNGKPAAKAGVRALLANALDAAGRLSVFYKETALVPLCESKKKAVRNVPESCQGAKQAAALMRLYGMDERDGAVQKTLLAGGSSGMSTFMSYYILSAIASYGTAGQALDGMKEYYGGMLAMGATTFWEDFDSSWKPNACPIDRLPGETGSDVHGDNGAYCYSGFRHSLCHGWASGPVPFLSERVLGIQIAEAGCRTIRLKPQLGHLTWAKGTFPTPFGVVSVSHTKREDGIIRTEFTVPDGIHVLIK